MLDADDSSDLTPDLLSQTRTMSNCRCDTARPAGGTHVDASLTVNEIMARWPQSIAPLNSLGIDTCCGGMESLRAAAEHAGVPLPVLLAAIEHSVTTGSAR